MQHGKEQNHQHGYRHHRQAGNEYFQGIGKTNRRQRGVKRAGKAVQRPHQEHQQVIAESLTHIGHRPAGHRVGGGQLAVVERHAQCQQPAHQQRQHGSRPGDPRRVPGEHKDLSRDGASRSQHDHLQQVELAFQMSFGHRGVDPEWNE
ncbi:hypothetical protein ADN00_13115 [Ornatilinea apprima]|uniref:Uncharacterized protein n=1 Tax=Ornatilinea apprima TaxID=1134406 RepID=A0A0P6Y1A1_9CHLR|nr:hypothetical protein ADN00_13115 [Ornatilinea apprima]